MTIPFTIAHRAGNDYEALERALAAGVDAVEIDVRLDRGHFAGRHDARLFHLPIYGARWYVRFSLGRESMLDEVLHRIEGKVALLVDVKNRDEHSLRLLLDASKAHGAIAGMLISSGFWDLMRTAQASEPDLRVYYSIGNAKELRRFLERQQATHEATGVSIKEGLLDKTLVERFLRNGVEIAAYDVYDLARARQLVDWGVAIITSGDLSLLRALKGLASA
jgi:glycerophosphoryl diester phosphodiesterase